MPLEDRLLAMEDMYKRQIVKLKEQLRSRKFVDNSAEIDQLINERDQARQALNATFALYGKLIVWAARFRRAKRSLGVTLLALLAAGVVGATAFTPETIKDDEVLNCTSARESMDLVWAERGRIVSELHVANGMIRFGLENRNDYLDAAGQVRMVMGRAQLMVIRQAQHRLVRDFRQCLNGEYDNGDLTFYNKDLAQEQRNLERAIHFLGVDKKRDKPG